MRRSGTALACIGSVVCAVVVPVGAAAAQPAAQPRTLSAATSAPPPPVAPGAYVAVTPTRLYDGRTGGATPARASFDLPVSGRAGVPSSGASAVSLTVTVTGQRTSGHVVVNAGGANRPPTSNLNFSPGIDVANSVVTPTGSGGTVALYNASSGPIDFVVDVVGYYQGGAADAAGAFTHVRPKRVLDTRTGTGGHRAPARGVVRANVGIADATVLMNLTVTRPAAAGHVVVYAHGAPRPPTSNLNFARGQTVANQVVVAVGADGIVDLYNASDASADLVLDVVGRYNAGRATVPGALQPLTPRRALDTRPGRRVPAHRDLVLSLGGTAGIPATGVSSLVLDVTVIAPTRPGWLQAVALGGTDSALPQTSSLNFAAGRTTAGLVTVATSGYSPDFQLRFGTAGTSDVVVDVLGYTVDGPGVARGSVSGTVSVYEGSADGVIVRAYAGRSIAAVTTTAADGTYLLAGLPERAHGYAICMVAPNDGVAGKCYYNVEWDGTNPAPGATPVTFFGGTLRVGVDADLRPPLSSGIITGRLTAADSGAPVPGATVRAAGSAGSFAAVTGSDGRYRISGVTPGSYLVCFTADNTVAGTPPTGYAPACHAGEVVARNFHTTAHVDGVLPVGAAISGQVTSVADGSALGGARVTARDTAGNPVGAAESATDGTYRIVGLTGGTTVTVCTEGGSVTGGPSQGGYLDACYQAAARNEPTPVMVTAGSTVTGIDIALASGAGISGTVSAGSTGVADIEVNLFEPDGQFLGMYVTTASDGTYSIGALQPGTYLVCFDAADAEGLYNDQCYDEVLWDRSVATPPPDADPVATTAGATTDHIDAQLTSP